MNSFLKALLVLLNLVSPCQFYATKIKLKN